MAGLSIRWSELRIWQRLLNGSQERDLSLGLVDLDGIIRAHQKAAGAGNGGSRAAATDEADGA